MQKNVFISFLTMFVSFTCLSQTGPGGVGNTTSNEIWLPVEGNCYTDAGVTLGVNNSSIQQWNDISGNLNNAIQLFVPFQPVLQTNQLNGFSTLRFDGVNDRILSTGINSSSQATIFVVVQFNAFTNNNDGVIQASPAGTAFTTTTTDKSIGMWVNRANGRIWGRGVQTNNAIRNISQTTALVTGQFYIITQDLDGANISQYVNAQLAGSVTYDNTIKNWSDFGIGRQGNESLDGELAELIVHRVSLNRAQRIITENYLSAKYNIPLVTNDFYTMDNPLNGNYDFEVAGIGRIDALNIHDDAQGSGIVRISNPNDLNNREFMLWGHDSGVQQAIETTDVPVGVQARFDRVWRVSEVSLSTAATDVGAVDIEFDLTGMGAVIPSDLALLVDVNNNGIFSDDIPIFGATASGVDRYSFSGVTALQNQFRFTLGTANRLITPLPISLLSFDATPKENTVQLTWATASEINNDFFTIERSSDLQNWEEIIFTQGAGNSNQVLAYLETDFNPLEGVSYYRLKQTDFDGQFEYFNIVPVRFTKNHTLEFSLYPNPVRQNETVNITSSFVKGEEVLVVLRDMQGKEFYTKAHLKVNTNDLIAVPIDDSIPAGIYIVIATSENSIYSKKLIIE